MGKTTFASRLSQQLDCKFLPEDPSHFPLVKKAFEEPYDWAYPNQLQFIVSKINDQLSLMIEQGFVLQEQDALSTHEMWTPVLQRLGYITVKEEKILNKAVQLFLQTPLRKPDMYIFLRCPLDIVINRIYQRSRDYEADFNDTKTLIGQIDVAMWEFYKNLNTAKLITDVDSIDFRLENDFTRDRLASVAATVLVSTHNLSMEA